MSWAEVSQLFAGACDLPAEDWEPFLAAAGCTDDDTRQQVLQLLEAHAKEICAIDISPLSAVAVEGVPRLVPRDHLVSAAGSYRVLERIGEGGVSIVYRAQRRLDGAHQTVALKVIKPGMDTRQVLYRFARERQLLATLEHPNIARLIDAGATPEGRPFLVMEHVDGEPIDRYCDRHHSDIDRRLTLFHDVCGAVQYAHLRMVVHSDLKPGNVLVTAEGRVKLLDFGLARLLSPGETGERTATVGGRWLTPNYASPEQARGEAITGATDVYGLGALLYTLLTGASPHRFRDGSTAELLRVVCEEKPQPPSGVLYQDPAAGEAAAKARSTTPAWLRRRLSGDLDIIVSKALAKDPAERYPSVGELAGDLRRQAEGLPIRARPPTLGYRLGRFTRRNWQLVTGAAATLVVLVGFLVALSLQVRVASRERLKAEEEKARAQEVGRLFVEIFEAADPNRDRGEELTVREAMERGLTRLRDEIGERPELKASLFLTAGRVQMKRGAYAAAESLVKEALAAMQGLGDERSAEYADGLEILGEIKLELRDLARARHFYRHASSLRQSLFGPHSVESAKTVGKIADVYWWAGDYHHARSLAREQFEILSRRLGPDDPETAFSQAQLGVYEGFLGDYERAVELLRPALVTLENTYGETHLEVARVSQGLGLFLTKAERFEEARHAYERALTISEKLLGPRHRSVAVAATSLAELMSIQGRFDEAEELHLRALDILEEINGHQHHTTANILHNLGLIEYRRSALDKAQARLEEALEIYRLVGSGEHPHAAQTGHYLAAIARRRGDLERAEEILSWVLQIRREKLSADHPRLLLSLQELGRLRLAQGRLQESEELFRQVLEARQSALHPQQLPLAESHYDLAQLLARQGRMGGAREHAARALAVRRDLLPPDHPEVVDAARLLGELETDAAALEVNHES